MKKKLQVRKPISEVIVRFNWEIARQKVDLL